MEKLKKVPLSQSFIKIRPYLLISVFLIIIAIFNAAQVKAACTPTSAQLCAAVDDYAFIYLNGNLIDTYTYCDISNGGCTPKCDTLNTTQLGYLMQTGNVIALYTQNTSAGELWASWSLDVNCADGTQALISSDSQPVSLYYDPSCASPNPSPTPSGGHNWYDTAYVQNGAWGPPVEMSGHKYGKRLSDPVTGSLLTALSWEASMDTACGALWFREPFTLAPVPTPVPPNITISKSANPSTDIGKTLPAAITFTLHICNTGGGTHGNPVVINDTWTNPADLWSYLSPGSYTDTLFGEIDYSGTNPNAIITFANGFNANACYDYVYSVAMNSGQPTYCLNWSNKADLSYLTRPTLVATVLLSDYCPPPPSFTLTKSANPATAIQNGTAVSFNMHLCNTGGAAWTGTMTLVDDWTNNTDVWQYDGPHSIVSPATGISAISASNSGHITTYAITLKQPGFTGCVDIPMNIHMTAQNPDNCTWYNKASLGYFASPVVVSTVLMADVCTPTFTITNTFTDTYTATDTPTETPSPSFTPTYTRTNTSTSTYTITSSATYTGTNTFTPTDTPTFTRTYTPTFTDTATDTPTFTLTSTNTPTISKTITPSFTVTETFTPTYTDTPTFTATPTFTCTMTSTPTYTASFTSTFTYTFTATPTFTQTYSMTDTRTDTPTFTATPTCTMTFTVTDTPTFTRTVTLTFTSTFTITPTATPINTYVKPGYLLTVKVYNEAGEVVKTITTVSTDYVMTGMLTSVGGNTTGGFSGNEVLTITMTGAGQGGTDLVTSWDGTTDGGQPAASGSYYISAAETDTYGHVMDITKDITLIKNTTYVQLNIFNSAGELVRTITDVNFVFPPDFLSGTQGLGISLDVPPLITTKQANASPVQIKFGAASADIMLWDGKNAAGLSVSSGVYEMQLVVKTETLTGIVAAKSVTVLENNDVFIGNIKTVPNPYNGSTAGIQLVWSANETGKMTISIYNIYGELIRNINATLESGATNWDVETAGGNQASNGLYIAVLQGISDSGNIARLMVKIAVNRRPAAQY